MIKQILFSQTIFYLGIMCPSVIYGMEKAKIPTTLVDQKTDQDQSKTIPAEEKCLAAAPEGWHKLPDEIKYKVLGSIGQQSLTSSLITLAKAMRVCQEWYRHCHDRAVIKQFVNGCSFNLSPNQSHALKTYMGSYLFNSGTQYRIIIQSLFTALKMHEQTSGSKKREEQNTNASTKAASAQSLAESLHTVTMGTFALGPPEMALARAFCTTVEAKARLLSTLYHTMKVFHNDERRAFFTQLKSELVTALQAQAHLPVSEEIQQALTLNLPALPAVTTKQDLSLDLLCRLIDDEYFKKTQSEGKFNAQKLLDAFIPFLSPEDLKLMSACMKNDQSYVKTNPCRTELKAAALVLALAQGHEQLACTILELLKNQNLSQNQKVAEMQFPLLYGLIDYIRLQHLPSCSNQTLELLLHVLFDSVCSFPIDNSVKQKQAGAPIQLLVLRFESYDLYERFCTTLVNHSLCTPHQKEVFCATFNGNAEPLNAYLSQAESIGSKYYITIFCAFIAAHNNHLPIVQLTVGYLWTRFPKASMLGMLEQLLTTANVRNNKNIVNYLFPLKCEIENR